jgi:hypothetical protein
MKAEIRSPRRKSCVAQLKQKSFKLFKKQKCLFGSWHANKARLQRPRQLFCSSASSRDTQRAPVASQVASVG